jgi:hypothetical protein
MRIRLSDPALTLDLCQHFLRAGFTVEELTVTDIEVHRCDAPDDEQAGREVELHLRVWRAMNPAAHVETQ